MCVRVRVRAHTWRKARGRGERRETRGERREQRVSRWQDPATKKARVSPFGARRAQLARDSRSSSTLSAITGVYVYVCVVARSGFFLSRASINDIIAWMERSRETRVLLSVVYLQCLYRIYRYIARIVETSKARRIRDISLDDAHVCLSNEMSRMRFYCPAMYFPLRLSISRTINFRIPLLHFSISFVRPHGGTGM